MRYILKYTGINKNKASGFVLPFTLFICGIMLLISLGISTILQKQIFFSQVARDSQAAYYAADNAVACVISIEETYIDGSGMGIFPYNPLSINRDNPEDDMNLVLSYVNANRIANGYSSLALTVPEIKCAQSDIFTVAQNAADFEVLTNNYIRNIPVSPSFPAGGTEEGRTSTFKMKMNVGGGVYRCAKVTVNKTETYRQIIAQGYAICDRPAGSIERAVVNTTQLK